MSLGYDPDTGELVYNPGDGNPAKDCGGGDPPCPNNDPPITVTVTFGGSPTVRTFFGEDFSSGETKNICPQLYVCDPYGDKSHRWTVDDLSLWALYDYLEGEGSYRRYNRVRTSFLQDSNVSVLLGFPQATFPPFGSVVNKAYGVVRYHIKRATPGGVPWTGFTPIGNPATYDKVISGSYLTSLGGGPYPNSGMPVITDVNLFTAEVPQGTSFLSDQWNNTIVTANNETIVFTLDNNDFSCGP